MPARSPAQAEFGTCQAGIDRLVLDRCRRPAGVSSPTWPTAIGYVRTSLSRLNRRSVKPPRSMVTTVSYFVGQLVGRDLRLDALDALGDDRAAPGRTSAASTCRRRRAASIRRPSRESTFCRPAVANSTLASCGLRSTLRPDPGDQVVDRLAVVGDGGLAPARRPRRRSARARRGRGCCPTGCARIASSTEASTSTSSSRGLRR